MAVSLYDHQKKAVEMLRPGSVLCGGVGTGKSRTALAYFYRKICKGEFARNGKPGKEMLEPTPLYIITTARKRDTREWEEECVPFSISSEEGVGPVDIHIDSWNNIKKYVDVKDSFFIFDEQRLVGTGAWVKAFYKIAANNKWILLTATPGDTWLDYAPVFIANGFYKNITEFRNKHVIYHRYAKFPKVVGYFDERRLEYFRKRIVIPMEFQKNATQHHLWVKVAYPQEQYEFVTKNLWNMYTEEPIKNASELCYTVRKVVNSDHHRFKAVVNILENHPKAILFYNYDYELETLRTSCEVVSIPYSEWNGHKHEAIPEERLWLYLVQYTAGAEGWNCIETDTTIFYSQNYSYRTMAQASGRIDRMNTPFTDLYYYHIFSDAPIDHAIRKCVDKKKDFNEKTFASSFDFA